MTNEEAYGRGYKAFLDGESSALFSASFEEHIGELRVYRILGFADAILDDIGLREGVNIFPSGESDMRSI